MLEIEGDSTLYLGLNRRYPNISTPFPFPWGRLKRRKTILGKSLKPVGFVARDTSGSMEKLRESQPHGGFYEELNTPKILDTNFRGDRNPRLNPDLRR